MENQIPRVKLISHTPLPIETLWVAWQASKTNDELYDIEEVASWERTDVEKYAEVVDTVTKIIQMNIPISRFLHFNFVFENISVSFREQLVRHKVGLRIDDKIGIDTIPNLDESNFWCQSMRILDMGDFARSERYILPKSIEDKLMTTEDLKDKPEGFIDLFKLACHATGFDPDQLMQALIDHRPLEIKKFYQNIMTHIEMVYRFFVALGIPMEDARNIMPLGANHRIAVSMNFDTLLSLIRGRACQILQYGLWEPIIKGIVSELKKISPIFNNILSPPCVRNGQFTSCGVQHDNERRSAGEDALPPCTLWWKKDHMNLDEAGIELEDEEWMAGYVEEMKRIDKEYTELWGASY